MNNKFYRRYTRRQRHGHNVPVGLIIAELAEKHLLLGWSKCHKGDQFNRKTAAIMCFERIAASPIEVNIFDEASIANAFSIIPETLHDSLTETLAYAYRRFLKGNKNRFEGKTQQ